MEDDTRFSLLEKLRGPANATAWFEFVRIYEPMLNRYVQGRGVPAHDVGVVVSNVFCSLLRALPSFQFDKVRGRFRTWLYRVTINAITDHFRHEARIHQREKNWTDETPEPVALDSPDSAWMNCEHQEAASQALEKVRAVTNEVTWACFERYLIEDRSAEEVAAELGMLPNTIRQNASRVLTKVRAEAAAFAEEMES
jgi:RNA polymerase sigma-70 factor, ECF subfamily